MTTRPNRRLAHLGLVLFVLGGCNAEPPRGQATVEDSAGVRVLATDGDRTLAVLAPQPEVSIGRTDGPQALGHVAGALMLSDGRILVADAMAGELRLFDAAGEGIAIWGGLGEGPDEFQAISGLSRWNGDSLVVAEAMARRVTFVEPSGRTVARMNPVHELWDASRTWAASSCCTLWGATSQGRAVLGTPDLLATGRTSGEAFRRIAMADQSGVRGEPVTARGGTYTEGPRGQPNPVHHTPGLSVVPVGRGFAISDGYSHSVLIHDEHGTLHTILRRNIPRTPLSDESRDATSRYYEELAGRSGADPEASGLDRVLARSFADSLPAYSSLFVGGPTRLWAGVVHPSQLGLEGRLDAFDLEDGFLGSVVVPTGTRVLDVSTDRVLLLERSELGVQSVRAYRLLPSDARW